MKKADWIRRIDASECVTSDQIAAQDSGDVAEELRRFYRRELRRNSCCCGFLFFVIYAVLFSAFAIANFFFGWIK